MFQGNVFPSTGSASNIPMFKESTLDLESVKFGLAPSQDFEAEQFNCKISFLRVIDLWVGLHSKKEVIVTQT
jgi:hypothetical protein